MNEENNKVKVDGMGV